MAEMPSSAPAIIADAQPFTDLATELRLPISTLHLLRARGQGPKCFKLGRRLYVSRRSKAEWISQLEGLAGGDDEPEAA